MWLQNLLFLGIVVYSLSAPTRSPITVTRPWKHVEAIKEALNLLDGTPVTLNEEVEVVSNEFSFKRLTCVQTRLKIFEQGLRGNFVKLKGALNMTASYYQTYCPPTSESDCELQVTTFADFIDSLKTFLTGIPLECEKTVRK